MMWYLVTWSDKDNAAIYAWNIMGVTTKMTHAVSEIFTAPSTPHIDYRSTAWTSYVDPSPLRRATD
jgi:hypothetical protein